MIPQIFTIESSIGKAEFLGGTRINVFKRWFKGKETELSLTIGIDVGIIKNLDAQDNAKWVKGVWQFQLELDMHTTTPVGAKYVVYRPNLNIFLNNLPFTPDLPQYNYWGGTYPFSYPPIIFQVPFEKDDTLFRIEIAPDFLENNVPKTDKLSIGNVVLRGQKIADLT